MNALFLTQVVEINIRIVSQRFLQNSNGIISFKNAAKKSAVHITSMFKRTIINDRIPRIMPGKKLNMHVPFQADSIYALLPSFFLTVYRNTA
jgi:hypothetical protein